MPPPILRYTLSKWTFPTPKVRALLFALGIMAAPLASAEVQVGIAIGTPHMSIGINVPTCPRFVATPGYPVCYTPQLRANHFFYDGLHWVFQGHKGFKRAPALSGTLSATLAGCMIENTTGKAFVQTMRQPLT